MANGAVFSGLALFAIASIINLGGSGRRSRFVTLTSLFVCVQTWLREHRAATGGGVSGENGILRPPEFADSES